MMDNSKLEQNIKDKMSSFSVDVDSDTLWENLSEHVPNNKKKRVFPYFSSAVVLFVASLILLYFSTLNYNTLKTDTQIANNQSNGISKNHKDQTKVNNNKTINSDNNINNNNSSRSRKDQSINTIALNNFDDQSIESKSMETKTVKTEKTITTEAIPTMEKTTYSIDLIPQSILFDHIKNSKVDHENIVYNDSISQDATNITTISLNKKHLTLNKNNQQPILENITNNTIIPKIDILALLPLSRFHIKEKTRSFVLLPKIVNSHYFSLDFGFRLGYFNQKSIATTEENEAFVVDFNNFSSTKPIYGISLGLQYDINQKWYAKTGFELNTSVIKLHSKWTRENKYTNINLVTLKSQTNYEAIGHMYSYTIDIPVMIGYNFYNKYNWKISSEAGILLNLNHINKGQTLNEASKLTDIQSSTYPRNFNLGIHVGMKFSYKISSLMDAYINPQFTYRTTNYQYNKIKMNQRFSTYNMNIGIKYKL